MSYPYWYILDENGDPQPTWLIREHPITGETEVNRAFNEWLWGAPDDPKDMGHRVIMQSTTAIGTVSTIFLGLDHSFHEGAIPILFETMIFAVDDEHELHNWQYRYRTRSEAIQGHAIVLLMAEGGTTQEETHELLSKVEANGR